MRTNNSLNILNSTNTRLHNLKVIPTVNIIQGEITESDYNYYLNIIQSGIHVIRFIISILNEKYYNYLKVSHDLMMRLMKCIRYFQKLPHTALLHTVVTASVCSCTLLTSILLSFPVASCCSGDSMGL